MSAELTCAELSQICDILSSVPSVEKAALFGSRAMGCARHGSDIDIMLYGDKLKMRDIIRLHSMLDDTALPYHFDLICHTAKNAALHEHVKQHGKIIFE